MKELKKFLAFLMLVFIQALFTSCSDNKDGPTEPTRKVSTYTITVNLDLAEIIGVGNLQSTTDITFFEYNDKDEMISYQNWDNVVDGSSKKFIANKDAKKFTLLLSITAKSGSNTATFKKYSSIVYYLTEGGNVDVKLDGTLRVSNYNPI